MPKDLPVKFTELEALVEKHGTPLQLYDESMMRDNARQLIAAFRKHFPDFREYFAVKALPNPAILRVLLDEGCGLDCSSTSELYIARQLGVSGDMVMYTSNYTSKKDLGIAFDQGVIINLDDISLVQAMVEVRGRCPDFISFRLNPGLGRTDSETASNVLGGPEAKFGVPPEQIVEGYRRAKAAGATRFGIHMMTGSCVTESAYWLETTTVLFDCMARVNKELGINFEMVNIGGGLGIPYRPGEPECDPEPIAKSIAQVFKQKREEHGLHKLPPPRLCMECGRYVTGPFGWLVTRCQAVKESFGSKYFGVDACMANLMRPGMYGSYHHITVPRLQQSVEVAGSDAVALSKANVVGTLCENNDWFAKDRELPAATRNGDLFVIHDSGAHSHSMGFQYNGKLRAPELLRRTDGRVDLIRKRESIRSLYANCVTPTDMQQTIGGVSPSTFAVAVSGVALVAIACMHTHRS